MRDPKRPVADRLRVPETTKEDLAVLGSCSWLFLAGSKKRRRVSDESRALKREIPMESTSKDPPPELTVDEERVRMMSQVNG